MLARHAGNVTDTGGEDDPLGALLDRVEREFREGGLRRESQRLVGDVLVQGYLGLLPRMLGLSPGAHTVVLDVVQGAVLAIDGADVRYEPSGSSAQVRAFLLALARAPHSKQQLVEWLWGYRYDPERHDPLVYALVRRVRRLLGANEDWVRAQGGRYLLKEGVVVRVHEPGGSLPESEPSSEEKRLVAARPGIAPAKRAVSPHAGLNHRQILFLEWIATHRFASVADLMQAFAVSKATASRDLAALVEAGHLVRTGQARATRYALA